MRSAVTLEQCWHRVPGGTASATVAQVRALAELAGDRLELVGVAARHGGVPPEPWAPPIPVRHLPLPRPALYEAWHQLRRPAVQAVTGPVDVVHATTLVVPPPGRAALVVTVHDLAFVDHPELLTPRGLRFHRRGLELARRHADLVLCPSGATRDECLRAGFAAERLRVVPWGVDPVRAGDDEVAAVRARHGLDRPYVLFVGTREPRKNLAGLVRAWARAGAGHDLVVAGPEGWGEAALPGDAPPGGRLRVVGFVADDERRALYAGATVVAVPSRREGFGLTVLEAMAQGAAVVTSRGTATEEVAGGAARLVDPAHPDELAGALGELLGDDAERARLGRAGLARAGQMSWTATASATWDAYRELA